MRALYAEIAQRRTGGPRACSHDGQPELLVFCSNPAKRFCEGSVSGEPIAGAELTIESLKRSAKTDQAGKYVLADLPEGIRMLTVRGLGYEPTGFMVQVTSGQMKPKDFTLERNTPRLDTVKTTSTSGIYGLRLAAFEEHRSKGFGKFIDSTELKSRSAAKASDLMMAIQGVNMARPPLCRPVGTRSENCVHSVNARVAMNRSGCAMQVTLDGTILSRGGPVAEGDPAAPGERLHDWPSQFDLSTLDASTLVGVEIYRSAGEIPQEMSGFRQQCGAIYLWTKR